MVAHRGILRHLRPTIVALTHRLKALQPDADKVPSVAAVVAEAPASMRKSLQDLAGRARAIIGSALSTCGRVMTLPQVHAACPHSTCLWVLTYDCDAGPVCDGGGADDCYGGVHRARVCGGGAGGRQLPVGSTTALVGGAACGHPAGDARYLCGVFGRREQPATSAATTV